MKFGKKALVLAAGVVCLAGAGKCLKFETSASCQAQILSETEGEICRKSETKDPLQPQIAEKILRFHVLANSDTTEDQELKLKVRDAIGEYLAPVLEDAEDLTKTKELVQDQLPEIIEVAEQCIAEEGYDYEVTAELAMADFPEKTYGNYTFPAGEYEALEVYIGEAKGHNWWCVSFPALCLPATSSGFQTEAVGAGFSETLTKTLSGDEDYEIRFFFLNQLGKLENLFFREEITPCHLDGFCDIM